MAEIEGDFTSANEICWTTTSASSMDILATCFSSGNITLLSKQNRNCFSFFSFKRTGVFVSPSMHIMEEHIRCNGYQYMTSGFFVPAVQMGLSNSGC